MGNLAPAELDASDFAEGSEAYIRYCAGITMLQYPEFAASIHRMEDIDDNEEELQEIHLIAREIMGKSCQRLIRASLPRGQKTPLRKDNFPSHGYDLAEPGMREIVGVACVSHEDRLQQLNESFPIIRPAPFYDKGVYRRLVRAEFDLIPTDAFMDIFVPDPRFTDIIYNIERSS